MGKWWRWEIFTERDRGPERTKFDYGVRLNPSNWNLSSGSQSLIQAGKLQQISTWGRVSVQQASFGVQAGRSYLFKDRAKVCVSPIGRTFKTNLSLNLPKLFFHLGNCMWLRNVWRPIIGPLPLPVMQMPNWKFLPEWKLWAGGYFWNARGENHTVKNMEFYHREEKVPSF